MSSGRPFSLIIRSNTLSTVRFGAHALKLGKLMRPFSFIALMIRLRSGPFEPSVNVSSTEDVPIGCSIQSSIVTSSFHAAADKNKLSQLGSVQDVIITRVERLYGDGRDPAGKLFINITNTFTSLVLSFSAANMVLAVQ